MGNKTRDKLMEADLLIRRNCHPGPGAPSCFATIRVISGFEMFNTRPYHNYETWSMGYEIVDHELSRTFRREDLDDALREWAAAREKAYGDTPSWERGNRRLTPEDTDGTE